MLASTVCGRARSCQGPIREWQVAGVIRVSVPFRVRDGVQQHYDMTATIWGTYRNNCIYYRLYGRFKIRYDGTYTRHCWFSGTITYPYETDCNSGGILSGR
jgi:hypothetical protein